MSDETIKTWNKLQERESEAIMAKARESNEWSLEELRHQRNAEQAQKASALAHREFVALRDEYDKKWFSAL